MADNEIIKALGCCGEDGDGCTGCPRLNAEFGATITSCSAGLATNALSLINRQKEQIEGLQKKDDEWALSYANAVARGISKREEAIKEFAETIVRDYPEMEFYLHNLVKEVVGDDK